MLVIKITEPNGSSQTYSLEHEGHWTIGRSLDCDICVPVPSVSRKHLVIRMQDDQLMVRLYAPTKQASHAGGVLGTAPVQIDPGNEVQFGGAVLSLLSDDEASTLQDVTNPLAQHWEAVWNAYCPGAQRARELMHKTRPMIVHPHKLANGMHPTIVMYAVEGGQRPVCAVKASPFMATGPRGYDAVVRADVLWTPSLAGFYPVPAPGELLPEVRAPMSLKSHTGLVLPETVALFGAQRVEEGGQVIIRQIAEPLVIVGHNV